MTDIADRTPDDTPPSPDRRSFLKTAGIAGAAGAVAGAEHGKFGLAPIAAAQAQPAAPPKLTTGKWWPSKWGAEDEAGASNHITPAKVLDAAKWIRDGKIYKIGREYEQAMPTFGKAGLRLAHSRRPDGRTLWREQARL
jgi:hypothetical protein